FGQIKKIKGLDILLDATLKISTEFPEEKFKLVVAGRPWKIDKEYCKEKLKKLEESGKLVCRFGFIPDDELPHYLSAADLIVLPYRQVYQSGVLLLAMSLGCPVIASNIPGMAEIIKNDETGWLFRNEDFENLATTIQQALRSKEDRQKIALNARKCMEDQYSWADIGKETA